MMSLLGGFEDDDSRAAGGIPVPQKKQSQSQLRMMAKQNRDISLSQIFVIIVAAIRLLHSVEYIHVYRREAESDASPS